MRRVAHVQEVDGVPGVADPGRLLVVLVGRARRVDVAAVVVDEQVGAVLHGVRVERVVGSGEPLARHGVARRRRARAVDIGRGEGDVADIGRAAKDGIVRVDRRARVGNEDIPANVDVARVAVVGAWRVGVVDLNAKVVERGIGGVVVDGSRAEARIHVRVGDTRDGRTHVDGDDVAVLVRDRARVLPDRDRADLADLLAVIVERRDRIAVRVDEDHGRRVHRAQLELVERTLVAGKHVGVGLDRAAVDLEVPVAAALRVAGEVAGRCDVRAGGSRQSLRGGETARTLAEIAAVEQQVALVGQRRTDACQIVGVGAGDGLVGQLARAQGERARIAVREDVDGGDVLAAFEDVRHLRDAVGARFQDVHLDGRVDLTQHRTQILDGRVDEDDVAGQIARGGVRDHRCHVEDLVARARVVCVGRGFQRGRVEQDARLQRTHHRSFDRRCLDDRLSTEDASEHAQHIALPAGPLRPPMRRTGRLEMHVPRRAAPARTIGAAWLMQV